MKDPLGFKIIQNPSAAFCWVTWITSKCFTNFSNHQEVDSWIKCAFLPSDSNLIAGPRLTVQKQCFIVILDSSAITLSIYTGSICSKTSTQHIRSAFFGSPYSGNAGSYGKYNSGKLFNSLRASANLFLPAP